MSDEDLDSASQALSESIDYADTIADLRGVPMPSTGARRSSCSERLPRATGEAVCSSGTATMGVSTTVGVWSNPNRRPRKRVLFFRLEHLGLARSTPGQVFPLSTWHRFPPTGSSNASFQSASGGGEHKFFVQHASHSRFEHIDVNGGQVAFLLHSAQRCIVSDIRVGEKEKNATNGIYFYSCGDMTISSLRVEAVGYSEPGFGIKFERCGKIACTTVGFEGGKVFDGFEFRTHPQPWIDNCRFCVFENVGTANRVNDADEAIVISDKSSVIRFIGGLLAITGASGSKTLRVTATCREIFFDDVAVLIFDGTDQNIADELDCDSASDVRLNLLFVNSDATGQLLFQNRYHWRSPLPIATISSSNVNARAADTFQVDAGTISTIANGYRGQRLVLLSTGSTIVQASAFIKLEGGVDYDSGTAGGTLSLICVDPGDTSAPDSSGLVTSYWVETGRTTL